MRDSTTIFVARLGLLALAAGACSAPLGDNAEQQGTAGDGTAGAQTTGAAEGGPTESTAPVSESVTDDPSGPAGTDDGTSAGIDDPPVVWDVGSLTDVPPITCGAPTAFPCDHLDDDPWHAMGINCDVGPQVDGQVNGDPLAFYVQDGNLGTFLPPPFPPREGNKFLIMSSGHAQDMTVPNMYASNNTTGFVDDGADPPAPINVNAVDPLDTCADNPGLVGNGDCSNTIQAQWEQGSGAFDYAEMRFTTEVPFATFGFSYDLAMFSTEYPAFYQSGFNDMYIGWLESELWTGNVSFDEMGHPISLNAGFLDYKDAPNDFDCPACTAPELAGTAMVGHAGTKWLTTTAGVTPGEDITMVFAVFDLSDPILDTIVFLDNFQWGCQGGAPVTIPG